MFSTKTWKKAEDVKVIDHDPQSYTWMVKDYHLSLWPWGDGRTVVTCTCPNGQSLRAARCYHAAAVHQHLGQPNVEGLRVSPDRRSA